MNPFAAVVLMSFVAAPVPKDALANPDAKAVQGEWKIVEFIKNGGDSTKHFVETRFTFKGDKLTILDPKADSEYREQVVTFTLDSKVTPKLIELKGRDQGKKEVTAYGIYKLEGDKLTICYAIVGRERPKEFKSEPDSWIRLYVLERVKK